LTVPAETPWLYPALLQERAKEGVRCLTCERRCTLADGQTGYCRTRQNREGTLYTLTYGLVSSLSANPIEKKPLYHFYPGTVALTAGAYSCNFACPWCQNWHISKAAPPAGAHAQGGKYCLGEQYSPEEFVTLARRRGCAGTSISLNEPTLSLEWSLDVFRLAHAEGMYNTYVSNGYMTGEALRLLAEAGLDAMNVDLKGDAEAVRRHCGGVDVEHVWRTCCLARELGIHLEITTLVIPGVNDVEATLHGIARRIAAELGPEVPWHVTAYVPAYRYTAPPTPLETVERAWQVGRDEGLSFVYIGNVPGHRGSDTTCPGCGTTLIRRRGLGVRENVLDHGCCPHCGYRLPGRYS
jgi:pyruvate formate lyase activating enzyme